MVDKWRRHDVTNEPGFCLWCGLKLRKAWQSAEDRAAGTDRQLGDYSDGYFCGLRCAYQFAVTFAGFGKRLNPRDKCRE